MKIFVLSILILQVCLESLTAQDSLLREEMQGILVSVDVQADTWKGASFEAIYESEDRGKSWTKIGGNYFAQRNEELRSKLKIKSKGFSGDLGYSKIISNKKDIILIAHTPHMIPKGVINNCILFSGNKFKSINEFSNFYIKDIEERSDYFIAYGHTKMDWDNFKEVKSCLFYSKDLKNWKNIFEWSGHQANNMFINEQEEIYLISSIGGLKLIKKVASRKQEVVTLLDTIDPHIRYPGDFISQAFYFLNPSLGYSYTYGAGSHSDKFHQTTNGGKKWISVDRNILPFENVFLFKNVSYFYDEKTVIKEENDRRFMLLNIENYFPERAYISDMTIDKDWNIFVKVWEYGDDLREWLFIFDIQAKEWVVI